MSIEDIKRDTYVEVDKNMKVETSFNLPDLTLYDPEEAPFSLSGVLFHDKGDIYRRMPEEIAQKVSPGVEKLSRESTGIRLRFSTDSAYVYIKAELSAVAHASHLTHIVNAGFDIYEDTPYKSHYLRPFIPPLNFENEYEQVVNIPGEKKMRSFTLNFPIHSIVKKLYIGVQKDAKLAEGKKYYDLAPIVIYGSSIVHGTGATRPGNIYSNILSRSLNMNVINLGFSGQAKGEEAIAKYIAGLDMSVFVCDYDHNAPSIEHLIATHLPLYKTVREAKPDIPYIIVTKPDTLYSPENAAERRDLILDTYRYAIGNQDKNVYFLDGHGFFDGVNCNECSTDGTHPGDAGYLKMAEHIEAAIRYTLRKKKLK